MSNPLSYHESEEICFDLSHLESDETMKKITFEKAMEKMKETLLENAMANKWEEVIKTYQKNKEAHTAKINGSGDTALHIAVSNGEVRVVEKLVAAVSKTEGALEMKNELGNTPLHLAAYLGSAEMCSSIAACNSKLMGLRNDDEEPPFFLAVRLGRKEAFHAMHNICGAPEGYDYCRAGKDGETILHSAISGEFFDLAFYIMNHYKELLNFLTLQGYSPLHILANKPSAFRSGSQIRGLDKLIYLCIFVDELQLDNHEAKPNKDLRYMEKDAKYPQNYRTCAVAFDLLRHVTRVLCCENKVEKMREKKEKHFWSLQIMKKMLEHAKRFDYADKGRAPGTPAPTGKDIDIKKIETPILIAAKNGITEIVEGILECFPVAIQDMNKDEKNIVLLAVENRQLHLYKFLLMWNVNKFSIFSKTDKDGNSALHLAASLDQNHPWLTPGVILQMQWEIKWFEFVKNSMPDRFFPRYNIEKKTATEIFSETHADLAVKDSKWLSSTSNSCSVVAALVATVAFTASTTIPGGVKSDDTGTPALQNDAAFTIFAISSLVALGFSVTAVVIFLAILTARHNENDFRRNLPTKLLVGLTSLLISIASMLLCFCAGHFLVLKDKFEYASLPLYVVTCLPLTFFAILQFPQYVDLVIATISNVPQRFPSSDRMPFVVGA